MTVAKLLTYGTMSKINNKFTKRLSYFMVVSFLFAKLISNVDKGGRMMKLEDVIDELKLELSGYILDLEITDETLISVIKKALRELTRYWDESHLLTVPFASCIDLSGEFFKEKVSSIVKVYRTEGIGDSDGSLSVMNDPVQMAQFAIFSNGGTMYSLQDYVMNYASWMSMHQIRNTMSTDLAFKEDRHNNKLYINRAGASPNMITIEYIPKLTSIEDIKSDYWIDILIKYCVALTKVVLGRIRTRFTQTNALWTQDGEKILEEGNTELKELREMLRLNSNMVYIID